MQLRYVLLILIAFALPWMVNAYKFTECDFESDYKCEVIHGLGIVAPPASWITVWFEADVILQDEG